MRKHTLLVLLLVLMPTSAARSGDGEVRLLTDETIPLYLARGRELARNQQWKTMIDVLQRIVIGDPKIFTDLKPEVLNAAVYSDDGLIYYPARELCLKELAAMPPEGLREYRTAYDAKARAMFKQAEEQQDVESRILRYTKVYDEFLVSSVGDDALERCGDLNLALGRYYEALAQFRRLVEVYPKDTDRDLAMILAKAAYCAARIGDIEHRDVLLERVASEYPGKRIKLLGKLVATGDLATHDAMAVLGGPHVDTDDDWPVAGGNPARVRIADDLPDKMPRRPFWRYRLSERDARLEATYGKRWQVVVHDRAPSKAPNGLPDQKLLTPYPTVRPILYGGLVLYKDCLELIGRNVGSGRFVPLRGRYVQPAEGLNDPKYLYPVREVRPGHYGDDSAHRTVGGHPPLPGLRRQQHRRDARSGVRDREQQAARLPVQRRPAEAAGQRQPPRHLRPRHRQDAVGLAGRPVLPPRAPEPRSLGGLEQGLPGASATVLPWPRCRGRLDALHDRGGA